MRSYNIHTGVIPHTEPLKALLRFILVWSPVIVLSMFIGALLGFEWVAAHIMWLVGSK